ncbi:MAG: GDP-mannose 4,6-dehydratase, partial [Athalassotoga sp.]
YDQGWIGWFVQKAFEIKKDKLKEPFTVSGNGKQVRDLLHVDDVIDLYFKASDNIEKVKGEAFNIGGGIENSLSILELFDLLENELQIKMEYKKIAPRQSDQKIFVADITKIKSMLDWQPRVDKFTGINNMIEWIKYFQ